MDRALLPAAALSSLSMTRQAASKAVTSHPSPDDSCAAVVAAERNMQTQALNIVGVARDSADWPTRST